MRRVIFRKPTFTQFGLSRRTSRQLSDWRYIVRRIPCNAWFRNHKFRKVFPVCVLLKHITLMSMPFRDLSREREVGVLAEIVK